MIRNRLSTEAVAVRIPQPPPVPVTAAGFMLCPVAMPALNPGQQWLYQQALELAQAVVRPSLPERDILGKWN